MQFLGHRQAHEVEGLDGADQDDAAEQRRRDVVQVASGDGFLRDQAGLDEGHRVQRRAEQRVHRDGTGHGGRGASALTAGERQPLANRQPDPPSPEARGPDLLEDSAGGKPGGVSVRLTRELRMARIQDREARGVDPLGRDGVAWALDGQPQDVEAGPDVSDTRGCERRDASAAHAPARRRMSFSTPAAVTSAPAPGPVMTSGFDL